MIILHETRMMWCTIHSPMPDTGVYQMGLVETCKSSVFALLPVTRHNKELVEAQPWTSRSITHPPAFTITYAYTSGGQVIK